MGETKEMSIADGIGRDEDGNVIYPYGTSRDTFWPPQPESYVDVRKMYTQAVERSWWFNFEDGEIAASWTEAKGNEINLRVFRKWRLTPERFEYVKTIKAHLDKRGVECCEDELRCVLHEEHAYIKSEAEAEIIEYQHYLAGIPIGKKVYSYPRPRGLVVLPNEIVGVRHLDHFPYNFGCRAVARDWLGFPPRPTKSTEVGNYLHIKKVGVDTMERDELRDHLRARGQDYERGKLTRPKLQELLKQSMIRERDRRKVHWFCCADDKCRKKGVCISYDPDAEGHEMIAVGPSLIISWDKVPFISFVFNLLVSHISTSD
jgi:hypothetical protein